MINLNGHYAKALLEYGESLGKLHEFYSQGTKLLEREARVVPAEIPGELIDFLRALPRKNRKAVLRRFVRMAHERLGLIDVCILAPDPLSGRQLELLTGRLAGMFGKRPVVSARVDESLLGGVRVIAGNVLLEDSISRELSDLQRILLKEVLAEHAG